MTTEKWNEMWKRQHEQQVAFNLDPHGMNALVKAQVAKDLSLGLYEEVSELSKIVGHYKAHVLKTPPIEKVNVADGAADVLKYLISIAQLYSVTAEELFQAFVRKSNVVDDRAKGERLELERDTKLIIVDVDNVIADLSGWQSKLNEARGGAPMNDRTVQLLESLKEDFYRDGGFLHLPPIDGAADGLKAISEAGWKIVLISARPYWQYKRVYGDTVEWLQKHGMTYDLILFNKDKAEAIYEHIFPARPSYFIEDREKHAKEVAGIGVPVLLLDWDYNRDIEENGLITRMADWPAIVKHVDSPKGEQA